MGGETKARKRMGEIEKRRGPGRARERTGELEQGKGWENKSKDGGIRANERVKEVRR